MKFCCAVLLACVAVAATAELPCPQIYSPQCGEDGKVYSNWCLREHSGVSEAGSWESCRKANHPLCPSICPADYNPICGSDGNIYVNRCMMQSANCGKMMIVRQMSDCKREE